MLNITNHQGNKNQNHNKILPPPVKIVIIKNQKKMLQVCGVEGTFVHYWRKCDLV